MKVSFTISRKGKRYNPYAKPKPEEEVDTKEKDLDQDSDNASSSHSLLMTPNQVLQNEQVHPNMPGSSALGRNDDLVDLTFEQRPKALEPSFSLNLFTDGYIFGNVEEFFQDVPHNLNPYDRHAKPILRDIEYGRLPVGIASNRDCKYVNGTLLCEVRDYREDLLSQPDVARVLLKMDVGNIIEDASSMPNPLTIDEQLILESRVVMALNPHVNLDPTPYEFKEIERVINLNINYGKNELGDN